eukprot:jgi/Chrzof1/10399/Cz04g40150.t1
MVQDLGLRGGLLLVVLALGACASTAAAATPVCRMNIQGTGGRAGGRAVRNASLVCSGGTITAAADRSILGPFTSGFRGVVWDEGGCGGQGAS